MAASVHVLAAVSAHALRSAQVTRFANVSRLALLAWDYLIMLHREKRFVWDAPFRISSVIYYTVRYPVLVFQIFNLVVTNRTAPVCKPLDQAFFTISISLPRVALCAVFVLRAYAVASRTWVSNLLVGLLAAVGSLSVILDIVRFKLFNCHARQRPAHSLVMTFMSLIVFDVLATSMLAWRIYVIIRETGGLKRLGRTDMYLMLMRSGALYYIVITTLQTGAIALYFLPQGVYSTVLNNYLTPLSTILVSRFLLDLREMTTQNGARYANDRRSEQLPSSVSGASVIEFAAGRSNSKSQTASSAATRFGGGGVLRDFEDPPHWGVYITHARKQAGGWEERDSGTLQEEEEDHTKSTAWPMEGLTARAQAVEERLARGSVV